MYILYADEAGSTKDADQQYFVLGGVAIFERQGFWLSQELDKIAQRFDPADAQSVELHGSPMFGGRGFWRRVPRADREQAISDALSVLAKSHPSNRIFGAAILKSCISPIDPVEYAFEQIAIRFDKYLGRLYKGGDPQRGIIVFDKTTYEITLQKLANGFRNTGHRFGVLRNLAEVPLFLDSKASRLVQLADLIAYAIFRHFERGDSRFYSIIENRFDAEGGVRHGLYHLKEVLLSMMIAQVADPLA